VIYVPRSPCVHANALLGVISEDNMTSRNPKRSDAEWLKRLKERATREEAANHLVHTYNRQLLSEIRRKLSEMLNPKIDPEDVAQMVWGSFFSKAVELLKSDTLFPLLAEMSRNKAISEVRKRMAEKRSPDAELSWDAGAHSQGHRPSSQRKNARFHDDDQVDEANGNNKKDYNQGKEDSAMDMDMMQMMISGATPDQAAIAIDLFRRLPDEYREIMRLRMEGFDRNEIAETLGCSCRMVDRRTKLIQELLRAMCSE
jgi:RNA polymerase sigma factor (sigma-70 family)